MTRIFALHSAYGLATAAAAIDGGLIGGDGERLLVPFVSARVPETTTGIGADPALASLRSRFHRIEDLDALLGPLHPSAWEPDPADLPLLERLLTRTWDLDRSDVELFVQSPQVAPARTLMSLFPRARITIVGDGLMTYSPMRVRLPHTVAARIGRVVYADVVPGVRPLVGGRDAECVPVPPALFRAALEETASGSHDLPPKGASTVLVLGQYLSALGLVEPHEEVALQVELVDRAAEWAPQRVVFKPHPAAPPLLSDAVGKRARALGMDYEEYRGPLPAELLGERLDARAVVAGFSTALPTVRALFGTEIGAAGTRTILSRLSPYQNSNRVPATIVDALTRADSPYRDPERLQQLVDAVGFVMQPETLAHLRPRAERMLASLGAEEAGRYFAQDRLDALGLPGARPPGPLRRAVRPAGGVGRMEELRLTAAGARRRLRRAWRALRGR